jgi:hypothetical protein
VNPFEFALAVIIITLVYSAWRMRHLNPHRMRELDEDAREPHSGREAELEREVEDLRERVKVLERIATDGRDTRRLSDEIEKLREK